MYSCIGIGYWIGSYQEVHQQNDHRGGIPMYWKWGLNLVKTETTSLDKINTRDDTPMDKRNVVIGVVTWQNRFRGGIPRCPSLKLIILGLLNYFQFQFQYLIYYHATPRGNFVYKLGTILSSNALFCMSGTLRKLEMVVRLSEIAIAFWRRPMFPRITPSIATVSMVSNWG